MTWRGSSPTLPPIFWPAGLDPVPGPGFSRPDGPQGSSVRGRSDRKAPPGSPSGGLSDGRGRGTTFAAALRRSHEPPGPVCTENRHEQCRRSEEDDHEGVLAAGSGHHRDEADRPVDPGSLQRYGNVFTCAPWREGGSSSTGWATPAHVLNATDSGHGRHAARVVPGVRCPSAKSTGEHGGASIPGCRPRSATTGAVTTALRDETFDQEVRATEHRPFVTASERAYEHTGDGPLWRKRDHPACATRLGGRKPVVPEARAERTVDPARDRPLYRTDLPA